jgi:hypothetical protein
MDDYHVAARGRNDHFGPIWGQFRPHQTVHQEDFVVEHAVLGGTFQVPRVNTPVES